MKKRTGTWETIQELIERIKDIDRKFYGPNSIAIQVLN